MSRITVLVNKLFKNNCYLRYSYRFCSKDTSVNDRIPKEKPPEVKRSGFADFIDSIQKLDFTASSERDENETDSNKSFSTLLRNSKLMQIGDVNGKIVQGTIFHTFENDLYIDFGNKFYCVCPRPKINPGNYGCGMKVRLRLTDLEMASRFLGANSDLTLLEADATLLGLSKS